MSGRAESDSRHVQQIARCDASPPSSVSLSHTLSELAAWLTLLVMAAGDWAKVGLGFAPSPASSSSSRTASKPSQSKTASRRPPPASSHASQQRLFPLSKAALVTPRDSPASTSSQAKAKQSKLAFGGSASSGSRRKALAEKGTNRADEPFSGRAKGKGKARARDDDDDGEEEAEDDGQEAEKDEKPGFLRRFIFGAGRTKSTPDAASRSTPSLGRTILRPSQPRGGTTIEFDYSQPADQSWEEELAGEEDRRKRRRTEEKARWGGLEMCDERVHGGFGMGSQSNEVGGSSSDRRIGRRVEADQDLAAPSSRRSQPPRQRYEQNDTLAVDDEEESSAEPSTLDSSASHAELDIRAPSAPLYSTARSHARAVSVEASPSTASSTSSTADTLQAQLVPHAPVKRKPVVLVPDSDPPSGAEDDETFEDEMEEDERELDELVERLGGKGANVDDSGFAEGEHFGEEDEQMLNEVEDDEEKPAPTILAAIDLTTASSSPIPVRRPSARTSSSDDSSTSPSNEDDVKPFGVGSRSDSSAGATGKPLGPSDSAILMPPPVARFKRLRRGAPSSRECQGESDSPEQESQVKLSKKRPRVLVEETQPGFEYPTTITVPHDSLPLDNLCEDTQYPDYAPLPLPHPDADFSPAKLDLETPLALPTPRHLSSPIRPLTTPGSSSWKDRVDVAWAGARPPSPNAPRQSRLGEFFARQGGGEDDEVVQDSQMAGVEDEGEMRALERALVETRARMKWWNASRSRSATPTKAQRAQADEADEIGDPDEEPLDQVPDSDPEDDASCLPLDAARSVSPAVFAALPSSPHAARQGTASPLGTPVKPRFPRYSPGKMRSAVERWEEREKRSVPVEGAVKRVDGTKQDEPQKAEDEVETQWESYWSYPSSSPDPLLLTSTSAAPAAGASTRSRSPLPAIQLTPHQRALIDEILAEKKKRRADRCASSRPSGEKGDGGDEVMMSDDEDDIPEGYRKNEKGELERIDADRFNVDAMMGPVNGEEDWGDTLTGW
ncbi:Proteophosphoglycan ppg4 [Rhodotorula toruloides ATCC 204091]|uniref:Proteophosphoglycan ppg4 n=1 Tax=Rhodotorula toruloides TaxID=5286 RepID=A0A0K3CAU0_RHOTO|nr:Proteophosphoglycan ppg4 [Rhodotorula toruloides ATCC 204091]PRQ75021.1 Proteophosphoglycan ppg4 [Rhodotorula toruloides]